MKTITMSAEETAAYDGNEVAWHNDIKPNLMRLAEDMHAETGETVEIVTADGVVVDVVQ